MSLPRLPFLDVFRDASGGNIKTPQTEFLKSGDIPVVDQSQQLVAGYTNDRARVCKARPPVIVFGDHTRAIKYVDFEFAMGADGTKVLVPKVEADTKFLYHALKAINIPSAGYSRHYKFLKETEIPFPPLAQQKRIVEILDAADALRAKRRESIAQLDSLLQSTFLDMFGDPVTNPMGWDDSLTLGNLADIVSGITKGRKANDGTLQDVPYLAVSNVQDRHLKLDIVKTIRATAAEISRYALVPGDLLLTEGGDPDKLGRGSLWEGQIAACIHQNHVFRVRLTNTSVHPAFLNWIVGSQRGKKYFARSAKQTTGIASINMKQLRAFPMLVPPIELQRRFAAIVESVERQKDRMRAHLAELDALFGSLQSSAFSGAL